MTGRVESGQLCTVTPPPDVGPWLDVGDVGDVVLCRVAGREYLHLVKALDGRGLVLIGNNRGGTNGWTSLGHVYGKLSKVET